MGASCCVPPDWATSGREVLKNAETFATIPGLRPDSHANTVPTHDAQFHMIAAASASPSAALPSPGHAADCRDDQADDPGRRSCCNAAMVSAACAGGEESPAHRHQ